MWHVIFENLTHLLRLLLSVVAAPLDPDRFCTAAGNKRWTAGGMPPIQCS
jgi:hypothetical protein